MVDWTSDSDDGDKLELDSDGEVNASSALVSRNLDAPGPSTLVRQDTNGKANGAAPSDSLVRDFVGMGFTEEMVLKAIKETGESDTEALLNLLLTYKLIGGDPSVDSCSASGCVPQSVEDDDADDVDPENWDDDDTGGNSNRDPNSDGSGDEEVVPGSC